MVNNHYLDTLLQNSRLARRYRPVVAKVRATYQREGFEGLVRQGRRVTARLLMPKDPAGALGAADTGIDSAVVNDILSNLAIRDWRIVGRLLALFDEMHRQNPDPRVTQMLFQLDELVTQLRHDHRKKLVLAGRRPPGGQAVAQPMLAVIRGGMSSAPGYARVRIRDLVPLAVVGDAAKDVSGILTELLTNALHFSPPESPVIVHARMADGGAVVLRVEDAGIGIDEVELERLNGELLRPPVRGLLDLRDRQILQHLGLVTATILAKPHGIGLNLGRRDPAGVVASVLLPPDLLCDPAMAEAEASAARAEAEAKPAVRPQIAPKSDHVKREHETTPLGLPKRTTHVRTTPEDDTTESASQGRHARTTDLPEDAGLRTTAGGLPVRRPGRVREFSAADTDPGLTGREPVEYTELDPAQLRRRAAAMSRVRHAATDDPADESARPTPYPRAKPDTNPLFTSSEDRNDA
ncbi:ATP-binding protein [Kibdelosporangium aridum]|uniref:histidine kinase n=1 Tax=Kibdelosporangium aridum TaxID=2030 RepID=A0A428Z527_KIBAR|nr:ATP-binding protein [Kibdelosporangium aridum]RSM81936.1 ATP-binding protein [Kibdelosporangium aridum]